MRLFWASLVVKIGARRTIMIELTQEQVRAFASNGNAPPRIVNPQTHEIFVLVPWADYERTCANPGDGNGAAFQRNGSADDEKPLTPEQVETKIIDLIHCEPFMPFVVAM